MGRLRLRGIPFPGLRYMKGYCHCSLWKELKVLTAAFFGCAKTRKISGLVINFAYLN